MKVFSIVMLLCGWLAGVCLGVGGDMGAGSEPLADGSEDYPWLIEDFNDFCVFAGDPNYWGEGVYTNLMCDIDLDPNLPGRVVYTDAVIAGGLLGEYNTFEGISYEGIFDGNENVVRNLTINTEGLNHWHIGLFGCIEGGSITSLGIENADIQGDEDTQYYGCLSGQVNYSNLKDCWVSGTINGYRAVGGICGDCFSSILVNCKSSVHVIGTSEYSSYIGSLCGLNVFSMFERCCASGDVFGSSNSGGLCGFNDGGMILHCKATGNVVGDGARLLGGFCGNNYGGTISNCVSSGIVSNGDGAYKTGGFCGDTYSGTLANSYSTSPVIVGNNSAYTGGFCGMIETGKIENCWSNGSITVGSDSTWVSGFCGYLLEECGAEIVNSFWDVDTSSLGSEGDNNFGATGKTTAQMQTKATYTDAGWDFVDETVNGVKEFWQMPISGGYPELSVFNGYGGIALLGQGSKDDPYQIGSVQELLAVCYNVSNSCFVLTEDIDLSDLEFDFAVIPYFMGSFEGSGYSISNFNTKGSSFAGLVGFLCNGEILNVAVTDANMICSDVNCHVGAVCGMNWRGTIDGCKSSGEMSEGYCFDSWFYGGICGNNYKGVINNCISNFMINAGFDSVGGLCGYNFEGTVSNSICSVQIIRGTNIGGFCGQNYKGLIENCQASGSMAAGESGISGGFCGRNYQGVINNSFANCTITAYQNSGADYIGGFCGRNYSGTFESCFWDMDTSEQLLSDGGIGKTTAEMMTKSTFTDAGWDFDNVWRMCVDGVEYPGLAWEYSSVGDFVCGNGIDGDDLAAIATDWLYEGGSLADANLDGVVNLIDLGVLSENWLE